MIDLVTANLTLDRHHLRAWSGIAVDEGVGLICIVEVSDSTGRPLARFEEFLDASVHRTNPAWPRDDTEAARQLQERALDRARTASPPTRSPPSTATASKLTYIRDAVIAHGNHLNRGVKSRQLVKPNLRA